MKSELIRRTIQLGGLHDAHVLAHAAHVAQVRAEVTAQFQAAQIEVAGSIISTWVVAMCVDGLPIRTENNRLSLVSGSIWSTADKAQARLVARHFNEKLGETATVQLERSDAWRKRRIAKLAEFIAQVSV